MISHAYAEVNGVRLHYARAGAGPLVLFLHGVPEFWYAWRRQLGTHWVIHQQPERVNGYIRDFLAGG